nr:immunoglobulin heavy chain junction region [Mus musculus]NSM05000.1 immunoglobulin heavy chain junction region [Mus musculus]NSM06146.1 immunoglobulin heavy chain junction region [Mus musculus]
CITEQFWLETMDYW